MTQVLLQEYLFQKIKEKLPPDTSLADVVAELLHISNDSAYRRIRSETFLVLEETRILCQAFDISIDQMLQMKNDSVLFSAVQINNNSYSFEDYLIDIIKNLKTLNNFDQKEIIYLAKDLPLFHHFLYRPVFAFRYFFWMKSILQHPDFLYKTFSMDCLPLNVENLGKEVLNVYNNLPSVEIWNTECVNSIIAQVEYYRDAGYFRSEEDIVKIYEALQQTIDHINKQAAWGCKFLPEQNEEMVKANYKFFYNNLVLGDNTIMTLLNTKKILYLNYDTLNYLTTQDESFCNEVYLKLQLLMRRATLISNASEKQRNIFFNILCRKIPKHSVKNNSL